MRTIGRGKVVQHTLLLTTVFALVAGMTVIDQQLDERYTTTAISAQEGNFRFEGLKPSTTAEIRRMTEVKRPPDQKREGPDVDQWVREHELRVISNGISLYEREFLNRDRDGLWAGTDQVPLQRRQVPGVLPSYPSSRRILAVSDSFGAAYGLGDPSHAWTRRLEQLLNDDTYTGAYQVDVIAEGNRNIYSFAAWLESGVVGELNPDAIVVSLHVNDVIPHGYEIGTCDARNNELVPGGCGLGSAPSLRKYVECRDGEGGFISTWLHRFVRPIYSNLARWGLERHCTVERIENEGDVSAKTLEAASNPARNPYLAEFKAAAQRIIEAADGRPVYLLPLIDSPPSHKHIRSYSEILKQQGFRVIEDLREAMELVTLHPTHESDKLWASPVDSHFNSQLTTALATGAARRILDDLPPIPKAGPQTNQSPAMLSGYLPITATVSSIGPGNVLFGVGNLRGIDVLSETIDLVPCAEMGRPHARITLNQYKLSGKRVRVTLESAGSSLTLAYGGLNSDGTERRGSFKSFDTENPRVIGVEAAASTIYVGTSSDGCPADVRWAMAPFLIRIDELPDRRE
jgi:hypothetical protein